MAAVGDEEDEEDNQGKEKGKGKGKGTSALKRSPARGAAEVGMIGRILASALSNASTAAAAPASANA
jgi:hypothetical protein